MHGAGIEDGNKNHCYILATITETTDSGNSESEREFDSISPDSKGSAEFGSNSHSQETRDKMKLKCDICGEESTGTRSALIAKGWKYLDARIGRSRFRVSVCPIHSEKWDEKWKPLLEERLRKEGMSLKDLEMVLV